MRRWVKAIILAVAGAAGPVSAQPGPAAPAAGSPRLAVTIYNQNIALVEERRALDLPAGRSRQEFRDVSAAIRPETVSLQAEGVSIVEQNFDFDLLTPDKLMEEAVGSTVQIVRTNPGSGTESRESATVLAANEGVVLRIGDRIEVLRDDGLPTRVIFDRVPPQLRARPTLSVTLEAEGAGRREAVLSYLTTGLAWRADYVALFDEGAGRVDLQGWITLQNQAGTAFNDADVTLVAGDLNLTGSGRDSSEGYRPRPRSRPGVEAGVGAQVGDFYLYPLTERTTVEQNQTKQVSFLDARGVSGRRVYRHEASGFRTQAVEQVDVSLLFANSQGGGLGRQLPAGIVRVYQRDAGGEPKFIGENRIDHTPAGSELAVKTGEAFDVTVESTVLSQEKRGDSGTRYQLRYDFRNAKTQPVTVEFRQGGFFGETRLFRESQRGRKVDAYTTAWDVRVPAGGTTSVSFTVETDY